MKTIKKLINKLFRAKPEQSPSKAYYFRVYRWMARLPISGNEKLAYAYIYGYNYHDKGYWESNPLGYAYETLCWLAKNNYMKGGNNENK